MTTQYQEYEYKAHSEGVPALNAFDVSFRLTHPHLHPVVGYKSGAVTYEKLPFQLKDVYTTLDFPTKVKILHQLASAICFLHQNGVLHLDIKIKNMFLTADYDLKVLITPTVSYYHGVPIINTDIDLRHYGPPEKSLTPAADVWCFGILAFYILTNTDLTSKAYDRIERYMKQDKTNQLQTLQNLIVKGISVWDTASAAMLLDSIFVEANKRSSIIELFENQVTIFGLKGLKPIPGTVIPVVRPTENKITLPENLTLSAQTDVEVLFLAVDLYFRNGDERLGNGDFETALCVAAKVIHPDQKADTTDKEIDFLSNLDYQLYPSYLFALSPNNLTDLKKFWEMIVDYPEDYFQLDLSELAASQVNTVKTLETTSKARNYTVSDLLREQVI